MLDNTAVKNVSITMKLSHHGIETNEYSDGRDKSKRVGYNYVLIIVKTENMKIAQVC